MSRKFEDVFYQEEYDSIIKDFLLGMFVDDLTKTHTITELVYLPKKDKWLIKFEKDYIKAMQKDK